MNKITSVEELKNAILLAKTEQATNAELLKEQAELTIKSLNPVNLFVNAISDVAKSPNLIENILVSAMGLATGYMSKKLVIGAAGGLVSKLLGNFLQIGVSNAVTHNGSAIKSIGLSIFKSIFHKKNAKTTSRD
jgi:hypothetical protein